MNKLEKSVLSFVNKYDINRNSKVLIGLSGGPDSVALLTISQKIFKDVVAVHLNHNLRSEESDKEQTFCEQLCLSLKIPLYVKKLTNDEKSNGSQSKYRDLRYAFFYDIYQKECCDILFVGQHKNDLVETTFYNIMKGTGIEGLIGIKPISINYSMRIARPFLNNSKEDIIHYLKQASISYKIDSSNLTTKYTRNKIRLHTIPLLEEEYNVNLTESLSKLSANMHELYDMFQSFHNEIDKNCLIINTDSFSINSSILFTYHVAIIKSYLHYFIKRYLLINDVTTTHISSIIDLKNSENNSYICLPNGYICKKKNEHYIFKTEDLPISIFKKTIVINGTPLYVPEINKTITVNYVEQIDEKNDCTYLFTNKIEKYIVLTSYEEGSKIHYKLNERKKVKKLIKEKSNLNINQSWYIKINNEIAYIPQISFKNYLYQQISNPYILKVKIQ